jgi:hypothetical protein
MDEEDELVEEPPPPLSKSTASGSSTTSQQTGAAETLEQIKELLRLKKRVEVWVKPDGEGARRLKEVEAVEGNVRDVLVEMSQYVDV